MGSGLYGIGVSALRAAQAGMTTTSHNIANVNTVGYSRQEILQAARLPQNMGAGFMGQGVDVNNVVRRYDQFLGAQMLEAQTQSSNLTARYELTQQISNLLGDPVGGLTPAMQDFFNSVNGVANAPQSVAARQAMIGSAQSLVDRLSGLNLRMTQIRDGLNGQIQNSVNLINSYAKQISTLNENIVQLQAKLPGQPPNDLLDQRDQLLNQLSQEIRVSTVKQSDGSLDVFIGNGQSLVVGNRLSLLQTATSLTDPAALEVAYANGATINRIPQNALQGGNLGGFLAFRQNELDSAVNMLGRIAIGLADSFNQQHQMGMDLKGALGGTFFSMAAPRVTYGSSNVGNGVFTASINSTQALTGHDYSVVFDGTNYNVYDTSNNSLMQSFTAAQLAAGQTLTGTGVTLQLTPGAIANASGDSFLVRPTVDGANGITLNVTDPTKIAAASPIRSFAQTTNIGSGVIAAPTVNAGLPLNANLQQPILITFNDPPTTYTATGVGAPAGPQPYTAGAAITINGWTTQISGKPAANDIFTVTLNSNATTDGTNGLKLAQLQSVNTMINGTASYQNAYGQLISQVGTQTRELQVTSTAQASMLSQISKAQQSVSGVNLDEEAANLMRYQQSYQAAAKAMTIANSMFDTILKLGG